jgi:hypothetical protein
MTSATEAWLENMAMCFTLHDYTSNMKVHMAVFQLKGRALLWWKRLLPQLNMVSKTCHGNCLRNGFERGTFQRNSLSVSSMSSTPYDREVVRCPSTRPVLWSCSGMLHTLTLEKIKVNRFVFGLNSSLHAKVRILMPQTLHDVIQKSLIARGGAYQWGLSGY